VTDACSACLRRSYLIAFLASRIQALIGFSHRRAPEVLGLGEDDLIRAVAGARAAAARKLVADFDADRVRDRLRTAGTSARCSHGDDYPRRLGELADPPAVVYLTGLAERLGAITGESSVAIVGSRRATPYGLEVAYALGRGLGAAGVTVVSGLALGVDAAAHRGALDAGGPALAVLAGGPDVPYPKLHRPLHERLRTVGAVISEMPPGQTPLRWGFPARNRIMAALADLVIVVEASARSGSLHTTTFAAQLGRDVAAVPGRVTGDAARGSNELLRDGAHVILGPGDALELLFGAGVPQLEQQALPGVSASAELGLDEQEVLRGVESAAGGADAVGRAVGLPPGSVRAALGRLEVLGLVARDPFGQYERTAR
jgi:DNA processing protein